ncbi:DegT/DnrJ/EryC1/StrS family aminotransferase [Bacillus sp. FJAT-28004]|uniref:DegT/DnrJ/EryC1/StrS family aminotransferase n=1 Tax=Bacillus sp. FJAT-28004 TaxID=1679165 RepID=UPI0006B40FCF|nr:DegT/DnrJ/EryC1/StrS family aminotransferase [Bacillus sp. FJAT-28004]
MEVPLSRPDITNLEKKYVMKVLNSGQLSFGATLLQFEQSFCDTFNVSYAAAMNSGTSALHVAVKALGLHTGDEVITTPYSFVASGNCLLYEGLKPVFVDIDSDTFNIDTTLIEPAITPNTKAILVVHVFGQPCNMDEIQRIADKHKLFIIEDACEAIGATWKGKPVGTLGDMGVFAFYPNKQITTGEGGILITDNERYFKLASSLRNQGRDPGSDWLTHDRIGYNYRMSDLQAAVGLAQMERLTTILSKRERAAAHYTRLILRAGLPVKTLKPLPDSTMSWFVFIVMLPEGTNRDVVIARLARNGVQSKPYFPSIHLFPVYRSQYGFNPGDFPVSESTSDRTIAIPFYSNITFKEQTHVVKSLSEALQGED